MNKCLYLNKEHQLFFVDNPIPVLGPKEVLVKIMSNGICGSDIHFYTEGRLGNFVIGDEPYVPGHEASGIVVAVGSEVANSHEGDRVVIEPGVPCGECELCREGRYNICSNLKFLSVPGINGTLCEYIAVPSNMVHIMPDEMTFEQGALVEPLSVASHAVNRAGNAKGKTAAIIGAGPIGLFLLQAFKASGGGKAIMLDIMDGRLEIAKKLGADEVINTLKDGMPQNIANIVFETAGAVITTAAMPSIVKKGGIMVQVGHPPRPVELDVEEMQQKELTFLASLDYAGEFPTSILWLSDGRVNGEAMITSRFSFDKADEAFKYSATHRDITIKTIINNE